MVDPLISELLEDDPGMAGLIGQFVDKLPGIIAELGALHAQAAWPELEDRVHDLKGLGGGYGYPQLSAVAILVEADLRNATYEQIPVRLESLQQLLHRIQLGMESTGSRY